MLHVAEFHASEVKRLDRMNIAEGEDQNKLVAANFMEGFHSLCLDKKDIMLAEIGARRCSFALAATKWTARQEKNIVELKIALDHAMIT